MDERKNKEYALQKYVDKGYSIEYKPGEKDDSFILHHKDLKKPISLINAYNVGVAVAKILDYVPEYLHEFMLPPLLVEAFEQIFDCSDKDVISDVLNITDKVVVKAVDDYFTEKYGDKKELEEKVINITKLYSLILKAAQDSGLMYTTKKQDNIWIPVDVVNLDIDLWSDTGEFLECLQDYCNNLLDVKYRQAIRIFLYCYIEYLRTKGTVAPQEFFDIDLCDSIGLFKNSDDLFDTKSLFKQINKGLKKFFVYKAEFSEMLTRNYYSEIVMMFALFMFRKK